MFDVDGGAYMSASDSAPFLSPENEQVGCLGRRLWGDPVEKGVVV
jgi:hypothetical protein